VNEGPLLPDQHLLSRVLIKRFMSVDGRLRFYDLRTRRSVVKSYGPAGRGGAYTPHAPAEMEAIWGKLESRVPAALAAIDAGTVFDDESHVQTLKHLIALHFFRSSENRRLFDRTVATRLDGAVDLKRARLYQPKESAGPTKVPTHNELFSAFIDPETPTQIFEELFQGLQSDWFSRSAVDVRGTGLEIWDTDSDLVLPDVGALAFDESGNLSGKPFREVSTVVLPIGRRLLISLGPENARGPVGQAVVDTLTRSSFSAALRWVYSHPDADVGALAFGEESETSDLHPS